MRLRLDACDFQFGEVGEQSVAAEEHPSSELQRGNPAVPDVVSKSADATAGERGSFVQIHNLRWIAADALGAVGINFVEAGFGSADRFSDKLGFGIFCFLCGIFHRAHYYSPPLSSVSVSSYVFRHFSGDDKGRPPTICFGEILSTLMAARHPLAGLHDRELLRGTPPLAGILRAWSWIAVWFYALLLAFWLFPAADGNFVFAECPWRAFSLAVKGRTA